MIHGLKKKIKQKGRQYVNRLLGPSSSEHLAGTSSSVSISGSGGTNTPVPTPVPLDPVSEPTALTPPAVSPQVAPISGPLLAVVSPIPPSANAHQPLSPINHSHVPIVQDAAPIQGSLRTANNPPVAERSDKNIAWSGLKTLMEILNNSADAFPPLKSAIGGILAFIKVYDAKAEAGKGYKEAHQELDDLFRDLSGYVGGPMPLDMRTSIDNLARGIEREFMFVQEKEKRSWIRSAAKALEDVGEIIQCYERVQRLLLRFLVNASTNTWKIMYEEATERRLERLSPSMAAQYGSAESTELRREACTPGTRVDILDELQAWAKNGESEKIYWMNGMAGTGKTTIAFSFCDQLKSSSTLSASFFCSRQLDACRNAKFILPTIAYQLARSSPAFRYLLSKVLENHPDIRTLTIPEQFQKLIVDPLLKAEEILPPGLVVVIDALDECVNNGGVGLLLQNLISYSPKLRIKFFVASRPEPWIIDQMRVRRSKGVVAEQRLHELEGPVVQEDIRKYLGIKLAPAMLTDGDFERLVQQSGVLFIYAATVVRYIEEDNFSRSAKRVKLVLSTSPTSERGSDHMIGALYTGILEAAFHEMRDSSDREEMVVVLHAIMCAQEPLTVDVIACLLGLDVPSIQAALRPLLSVLHLSEPSGVVTTLHKSFPDYIFDKNRSGAFFCDPRSYNAVLARGCFNIIAAKNPPFNICNLESSHVFDLQIPDLERRVKAAISDAMMYACQYWSAHLRLVDAPSELLDDLHEFLSVRFLLWMEVMNLKERKDAGIKALHQVQEWLQLVSSSEENRELALDTWMFASTFWKSSILRSTPHIYVSALLFWPGHRAVSQYYLPKMKGVANVTGTALDDRTSESLVVRATPSEVLCVACAPDGKSIASGSSDHTIRIWDVRTGQMVKEPLKGHSDQVTSLGYSHDGTRIVSGSCDSTIRIWDVHTGQMIGEPLRGHTKQITSVWYSHSGTRIVSFSKGNTIRFWDTHTGEMIGEPREGFGEQITSVVHSPDGTHFACGHCNSTIQIWDMHTGKMVGEPLVGHTDWVTSVGYSYDGSRIVSGSADNTIRIWDTQTRKMIGEPLRGHTNQVTSVGYSSDGSLVVSGSRDSTIRIWDAHTGRIADGMLDDYSASMQAIKEIAHQQQLTPDNLTFARSPPDHTIAHSYIEWTEDKDGWLLEGHKKLLMWVPSELHAYITTSTLDSLRCDFRNTRLWKDWCNYYHCKPILPG